MRRGALIQACLTLADGDDNKGVRSFVERFDSIGLLDDLSKEEKRANGPNYSIRLDAQTAVAAARQLEYVYTELYQEPQPDLPMAEGLIVDLDTSVPEGAKTFTYYLYSGRAMARFTASWSAGRWLTTTLMAAQRSGVVQTMENGFQYTMQDLRHAGFMNLPLDTMLGKEDRRAHMRLLHDTGLWGKEDIQLPGLVKHPNITVVDAPVGGAPGSSARWSLKTPAEIMTDIGTLADTTGEATDGKRRTTHIWLPRQEYNLINRTFVTSLATMTILQWAKTTWPDIQFGVLDDLAASKSTDQWGTTHLTTDAALAIVKNKDVVGLVRPMDYTLHDPQYQGLRIQIPSESSTGGIRLVEPYTVVRMDGIGLS